MAYITVTPVSGEPISLEEAKRHLRISADYTDDDADVEMCISAAREQFEQTTGIVVAKCTRAMVMDDFPFGEILLDDQPVISVDNIEYVSTDNSTKKIVSYSADCLSSPVRIRVAGAWPAVGRNQYNGVRITYTAGYDNDLPRLIKVTLLRMITAYYEYRNEFTESGLTALPAGAAAAMALYRKLPLR